MQLSDTRMLARQRGAGPVKDPTHCTAVAGRFAVHLVDVGRQASGQCTRGRQRNAHVLIEGRIGGVAGSAEFELIEHQDASAATLPNYDGGDDGGEGVLESAEIEFNDAVRFVSRLHRANFVKTPYLWFRFR